MIRDVVDKPDVSFTREFLTKEGDTFYLTQEDVLMSIIVDKYPNDVWKYHNNYEKRHYTRLKGRWIEGAYPKNPI